MSLIKKIFITDKDSKETATVTNNGLDVNIQDQTTQAIFDYMSATVSSGYVLATSPTLGEYTITLVDSTGLTVGDYIGMFQEHSNPVQYFGNITDITGNVVTFDTSLPFSFNPSSTVIFELNPNLNVDGSTTPVIFQISNGSTTPVDITRLIFHITDEDAMDDGTFGGIPALTRGIVLRKEFADGRLINYWNVKTNGELGQIAYDKEFDDKAPAGVYGVRARLTFGGQDKVGVVIRLDTNDKLEMIVQDDLTDLISFFVMTEGHFTDRI